MNPSRPQVALLLFSIFTVALCGLTYELLAGAVSSYLLGNSVLWFSLTIGGFMSAMGIGAWLSRTWKTGLLEGFIAVEIAVGLIGGLAGPGLFWAYTYTSAYQVVLFIVVGLIGTGIGLEIPLLTRYLEQFGTLRTAISDVMSVDYAGALGASVLFPLVLLPTLGLMKTFPAVGLLNLSVAGLTVWFFRHQLQRVVPFGLAVGAGFLLMVVILWQGEVWLSQAEARRYPDQVIYAEQTPYQRLVLTQHQNDTRLYIDGHLQFSSRDEARYHETLVHPAMSVVEVPSDVLVMGGGDGLAVREILKYPGVERVTLVDLDPAMTRLGTEHPSVVALNDKALHYARVEVINQDAYTFLEETDDQWSVILMDFPDPHGDALAKLYSVKFYAMVAEHLQPGGRAVTQATSPYFAQEAFWCVEHTARVAGLQTNPYHVWVPSFGDWGFVMMGATPIEPRGVQLPVETRWLDAMTLRGLFSFPVDMEKVETEPNTLADPVLIHYYRDAWAKWF